MSINLGKVSRRIQRFVDKTPNSVNWGDFSTYSTPYDSSRWSVYDYKKYMTNAMSPAAILCHHDIELLLKACCIWDKCTTYYKIHKFLSITVRLVSRN